MKKKSIVRIFILLLMGVLATCKNKTSEKVSVTHENMKHMSHHIPGTETVIDSNLAYLLKPVSEQVVATIPTIKPESSTRILSIPVQGSITYDTRDQRSIASRVSGRIERLLIKYNYQPVRKGQLIMEIYSPDLAAAQRELLFIYQTDKNDIMLQKARQRLQLLGMQDAQIRQVLRTGNILYRVPVYSNASGYILEKPASGVAAPAMAALPVSSDEGGMSSMSASGSTPATGVVSTITPNTPTPLMLREGQYVDAGQTLFTIYNDRSLVAEFAFEPSLASQVKKGQKLTFYPTADPQTVYTGTIGLIQPAFRAGSNFKLARVYLSDTKFQVGQLITAHIPIVSKGWWVPKSAVQVLGSRSIVFKKEGGVFVPKPVQTKITAEGMVLIEDNISGWDIARNAAYLVDSESFIKLNSENQ